MTRDVRSLAQAPEHDELGGVAFRGPALLAKVTPFAVIVLVAEASIALPPGPRSTKEATLSLFLLAVTFAGFALPWQHLPAWASVLVPLTYSGSVLVLSLATGPSSGVGIVLLIPVVWTALFHRKWESATIVLGIVATETVVSVVQSASAEVTVRRGVLWFLLTSAVAVAINGLRSRVRQSERENARYQVQLRELMIAEDRIRIASELQDQVIERVFSATLSLQGLARVNSGPEARERLGAIVEQLDESIRVLRQAVFGLRGNEDWSGADSPGSPIGAADMASLGETTQGSQFAGKRASDSR